MPIPTPAHTPGPIRPWEDPANKKLQIEPNPKIGHPRHAPPHPAQTFSQESHPSRVM